jgi:Ca2+/Na+ antiporter
VERYYKWFDSWKNVDYVSTCGVVDSESDKASSYFTVAVLEGGLILCFLIAYLYRYLEKKHEKDDEKLLEDIEKEQEEEAEKEAENQMSG